MPLLFDDDYRSLGERGLRHEECERRRFFIFKEYPLPAELYTVSSCDVLVYIPPNYNQDGNDMFWTSPRLIRKDGKAIPATLDEGHAFNHQFSGREYCRWSRHWQPGTPGAWRPGRDEIISIQRRIEWALENPET